MRNRPATSQASQRPARRVRPGFTLVELLVVISIVALLIAILLPSLRRVRRQGKATVCLSQIRTLGQGIAMYAMDNSDVLLPGRMPNLGDGINWRASIAGGLKYRPTFLATMGAYVGVPAFDDPQAVKAAVDRFGEAGDRQNYANRIYVCPSVADWTDERNGCYGYNYQFLGNFRLLDDNDPSVFKNWPVSMTRVRAPGSCVAVADSMGTAASYKRKQPYDNNSRDPDRFGNEGFNLDPPRVDTVNGEMANFDRTPQSASAAHGRHLGTAVVLWMDAHASRETPEYLGYNVDPDGVVGFDGNNRFFHIDGKDEAWITPAP
jgi:prepilin-type N-terminal cleavage/methylation domain-containing protein